MALPRQIEVKSSRRGILITFNPPLNTSPASFACSPDEFSRVNVPVLCDPFDWKTPRGLFKSHFHREKILSKNPWTQCASPIYLFCIHHPGIKLNFKAQKEEKLRLTCGDVDVICWPVSSDLTECVLCCEAPAHIWLSVREVVANSGVIQKW